MNNKSDEQPLGENQIGDEELRRSAQKLHSELFPEEYNHIYDSFSEAKDRRRGIDPMSAEYIAATNGQRASLGFEAFNVGSKGGGHGTYDWILNKLRAGEEDSLITIVNTRKEEAAEVGRLREQERALLQTEAWQNQKVDEKLASDALLAPDWDRDDPKVVAFRILGAIFDMNPTGDSDALFHSQIRRLQPGKTDSDYDQLYRHASNEWMEVYGY